MYRNMNIMPASPKLGSNQLPLLTVAEVASILRVSQGWIRDHASGRRRPVLPSVKLGKCLRFRREDVQNFIEECTHVV